MPEATPSKKTIIEINCARIVVFICLALLCKYKLHVLIKPFGYLDALFLLIWAVCIFASGFLLLCWCDDSEDPRMLVRLRIAVAPVLIGLSAVLFGAILLVTLHRRVRWTSLSPGDWYAALTISGICVILFGLDATGVVKNRRYKRFLYGKPWWERRRMRKRR